MTRRRRSISGTTINIFFSRAATRWALTHASLIKATLVGRAALAGRNAVAFFLRSTTPLLIAAALFPVAMHAFTLAAQRFSQFLIEAGSPLSLKRPARIHMLSVGLITPSRASCVKPSAPARFDDLGKSLKVFFQLLLRVCSEEASDECADAARWRVITEPDAHEGCPARSFLKYHFAFGLDIAAHAAPCDTAIRLEASRLRLPFDARAERRFSRPSSVAAARISNLFDMTHPTGETLKVAEEIKDALDRRVYLYDLFRSLHNVSPGAPSLTSDRD
jgi:hypothetical protein